MISGCRFLHVNVVDNRYHVPCPSGCNTKFVQIPLAFSVCFSGTALCSLHHKGNKYTVTVNYLTDRRLPRVSKVVRKGTVTVSYLMHAVTVSNVWHCFHDGVIFNTSNTGFLWYLHISYPIPLRWNNVRFECKVKNKCICIDKLIETIFQHTRKQPIQAKNFQRV